MLLANTIIDEKKRPDAIIVYNKFKGTLCHFLIIIGGVDLADGHTSRYLYAHKKVKWTKACLFTFWKIIIVQAWKIYSFFHPCSQKEFIEPWLKEQINF